MDAPLSLTYKGTCEVLSDQQTIGWSLPTLAKRLRAGDPQGTKGFPQTEQHAESAPTKIQSGKKIGFGSLKIPQATLDAA